MEDFTVATSIFYTVGAYLLSLRSRFFQVQAQSERVTFLNRLNKNGSPH